MTNKEVIEKIEQAHGYVSKLFWIAAAVEDTDLQEFINEMDADSFAKTFPQVSSSAYLSEYLEDGNLFELVTDHELYGFVAEVQIPQCNNFRFNEETGSPVAWSSSAGIRRIEYVYAETSEELVDKVISVSEEVFQEYVKKRTLNR